MIYDLYIFHHIEYEPLFSCQLVCCKTCSSMIGDIIDLILLEHLIYEELHQPCEDLNIAGEIGFHEVLFQE